MADVALSLKNVHQHFVQGGVDLHVLKGVNLDIKPGEVIALIGQSGAGKSTLLHIAGLLERPYEGEVLINGESGWRLSEQKRTRLRRHFMGFVYQFHHLLPEFSAIENVMLPLRIAGASKTSARARAEDLLGRLGLSQRLHHRPAQLSGGEQQRVAMARALANKPKVLMADEPTGNLDVNTSATVLSELLRLAREEGVATLIATHDREMARQLDRCVKIEDGILQIV
ncbi:MAG: ABC transporter [Kordiimonas sp.]|nr:ABC transporter [Kordiimonas sp.]|tara:strand:- start:2596 stop:3276 length:681 start_codon:yes stop_codon:yes gene_type:complete